MDYQNTVDRLKVLAEQHAAIVSAADMLTTLGSLDNARDELASKVNAYKAELGQIKEEIGAAQKILANTKAQNEDEYNAAQKQVNDLMAATTAKQDAILQAARDDAQSVVDTAKESAKKLTEIASKRVNRLEAEATKQEARAKELADMIVNQTNDLQALEAKISAAKSHIQSILQG